MRMAIWVLVVVLLVCAFWAISTGAVVTASFALVVGVGAIALHRKFRLQERELDADEAEFQASAVDGS